MRYPRTVINLDAVRPLTLSDTTVCDRAVGLNLRARGCREAAATMLHGLHLKHRTPEYKFDIHGKPENQGRKQTPDMCVPGMLERLICEFVLPEPGYGK